MSYDAKNQELFNLAHALTCESMGIEDTRYLNKDQRKVFNGARKVEYQYLLERDSIKFFNEHKNSKPMRKKGASKFSASMQFHAKMGRTPKGIIKRSNNRIRLSDLTDK